MKILYIHGVGGQPQDDAYSALTENGCEAVSPAMDYALPQDVLLHHLRTILLDHKIEALAGTGLGGFFAAVLSAEQDLPVMLIDPWLNPHTAFPEHGFAGDVSPYLAMSDLLIYLDRSRVGCLTAETDKDALRILRSAQIRLLPADERPLKAFFRDMLYGKNGIIPRTKGTLYSIEQFSETVSQIKKAETAEKHRALAEQGNCGAQFNLGLAYFFGDGVPQSYELAMAWFRQSAEQGYITAQYNLGIMYRNGLGVKRNNAEAAAWFRKAADQGHLSSQLNLGLLYSLGHGVPQDYQEAMRWYEKAAAKGDPGAENNIGTLYHLGKGVPQDSTKAFYWFSKAAEHGDLGAMNNLGLLYRNGLGVEKDAAEAVRWFRKAAEQDYPQAQFQLGVMCFNGYGTPKDRDEAVSWFRKAAKQGFREAAKYLRQLGLPGS